MNEAYGILSDETKRRVYDGMTGGDRSSSSSSSNAGRPNSHAQQEYGTASETAQHAPHVQAWYVGQKEVSQHQRFFYEKSVGAEQRYVQRSLPDLLYIAACVALAPLTHAHSNSCTRPRTCAHARFFSLCLYRGMHFLFAPRAGARRSKRGRRTRFASCRSRVPARYCGSLHPSSLPDYGDLTRSPPLG